MWYDVMYMWYVAIWCDAVDKTLQIQNIAPGTWPALAGEGGKVVARSVLQFFTKFSCNEENHDCPGALPLQQLVERATLPTAARIRKASEHFWPQMRTGERRDGLAGLPIFCRLKVLKKVHLLPIWIQALKTHIVAVHYKKGVRWWDRLKSRCL